MTNNIIECVGCGKLTVGKVYGAYTEYSGTAKVSITFPKHLGVPTMEGFYCILCAQKIVDCMKSIRIENEFESNDK